MKKMSKYGDKKEGEIKSWIEQTEMLSDLKTN
jgi:hypothetical protein